MFRVVVVLLIDDAWDQLRHRAGRQAVEQVLGKLAPQFLAVIQKGQQAHLATFAVSEFLIRLNNARNRVLPFPLGVNGIQRLHGAECIGNT